MRVIWGKQIIDKEVFYDREVLKEHVEEVYIDKYVERVVEILREVPVDKIVERRVEVIKEIPVVRYVDRVVTKEIPIVQVVERVVEVLKERPVEVIKEVPVYVRRDASELVTTTTTSYDKVQGSQMFSYEARHSQQSKAILGDIKNSGYNYSSTPVTTYTSSPVTTQVTKAGVGMVLQRENDGTIFVRKVMSGSPAALDGSIQINDRLLSINNTNVQGMVLDKVFDMINGPEGTGLNMSLSRNGSTFSVSLKRGQVRS
jgi:C-terminal processing protease CtpA/Prc